MKAHTSVIIKDWNEQWDLALIQQAVLEGGRYFTQVEETGSDSDALVITSKPISAKEAEKIYRAEFK